MVYIKQYHIFADLERKQITYQLFITYYLIMANKITVIRLSNHPEVENAFGIVRAPVPTIRLNMYIKPTWN